MSRKFYEPESNDGWSSRGKFHVYILDTRRGHYVGHTGNLKKRLNDHMSNKVLSTRYSNPRLIWKSSIFKDRESASKYEAALKSWRDSRSIEYVKHTDISPVPFIFLSNKSFVQKKQSRGMFVGARKSRSFIKRARRFIRRLR